MELYIIFKDPDEKKTTYKLAKFRQTGFISIYAAQFRQVAPQL